MLWWILGAAIIVGLVLVGARFCYRLVFYNLNDGEKDPYAVPPGEQYERLADRMLEQIRSLESIPYEQVYICSRDGLRLAARYYHFQDNAPVQIQFHGYRGNALREYSGGNVLARELGYNSLVVDERAHGKSEGNTISFGILERFDCVDWIEYAINRFGSDTTIVLSGVSMGAATVLMASDLDLPANVAAITADCPYSSPGAIIRKVCRDVGIPGWIGYAFVALGGWVFGGFRMWQSSPVKAVRNTKIPIQLIHGEDDRLVPCRMSHEIYEACAGPKRLTTFADAGHGLSYLVDTPKYHRTFKSFMEACGILK